jgi:membrane protease YdiL (CAAX protease family)
VRHNAFKVVASGSLPPRAALHPGLAVVAVLAGVAAMGAGGRAVASHGLHVTLMTAEALLIAPGILLMLIGRVPLVSGLALRPVPTRTVLLALLAGATLWAASLGLMNIQFVLWRPPPEFLDSFRALHAALRPRSVGEAILSVAAIALMPAICEETLFRGIVLPSLQRWGMASALVGSAAMFALIHVDAVGTSPAFYRLPFAFAVGLGLAALRLATGSLIPSIAAHAVLNAITFATVFLSGAASEAVDEPQALSGSLLLLGGAAASAWIFRALRR